MTRMTGPDCVVMCNLINTHTHTHTHNANISEKAVQAAVVQFRILIMKKSLRDHSVGASSIYKILGMIDVYPRI